MSADENHQISKEFLFEIVNKQVQTIPYHNFSFYLRDTHSVDLTREGLHQRLLTQQPVGGMCYETSELLYFALSELKFDVHRVPAFPLNNKVYNPHLASTHNVLFVNIENKQYLIDVGYGYNSIRCPLEITEKKEKEYETIPNEKYQIVCSDDYYQLNMLIKDEWFSLYRFNRPIEFIDASQTKAYYDNLLNCSDIIPIRDTYAKVGKVTPTGRIGFLIEPGKKPFYAFRLIVDYGHGTKTFYESADELFQDVESEMKFPIPRDIVYLSSRTQTHRTGFRR